MKIINSIYTEVRNIYYFYYLRYIKLKCIVNKLNLEYLLSKFGYYKFPRYYIYSKNNDNDKWNKHGYWGKRFHLYGKRFRAYRYNYYEMLQFVGFLKHIGRKIKIESITKFIPYMSADNFKIINKEALQVADKFRNCIPKEMTL